MTLLLSECFAAMLTRRPTTLLTCHSHTRYHTALLTLHSLRTCPPHPLRTGFMIDFLLSKGADITMARGHANGESVLHAAARVNNLRLAKFAVEELKIAPNGTRRAR